MYSLIDTKHFLYPSYYPDPHQKSVWSVLGQDTFHHPSIVDLFISLCVIHQTNQPPVKEIGENTTSLAKVINHLNMAKSRLLCHLYNCRGLFTRTVSLINLLNPNHILTSFFLNSIHMYYNSSFACMIGSVCAYTVYSI